MVTGIGGDTAAAPVAGAPSKAVSPKTAAARQALAALSAPCPKSEAGQKLDEILADLKTNKSKAAQDAARQKLQRIKARLDALKLAAGSAAATGDARLARKVAQDIRDAARDLSRALADAGGGGSAAVAAAGVGTTAQGGQAAAATGGLPDAAPAAGGDDPASLRTDAAGVLKELKKIMRKLRETGLHPGIATKDRAEMEKAFAETDRALAGLAAVAAPSAGAVNLLA
jgi:hypothetical protein